MLKGFDNAVYLCFGTGVGGDVILNGKSIRKNLPLSCEIGHMITHPNGKNVLAATAVVTSAMPRRQPFLK